LSELEYHPDSTNLTAGHSARPAKRRPR